MDNEKRPSVGHNSPPQPPQQPADVFSHVPTQPGSEQTAAQSPLRAAGPGVHSAVPPSAEQSSGSNQVVTSGVSSGAQAPVVSSPKPRRKIPLIAIAVLAAVIVLGGAAAFAFSAFNKRNAELSCTPVADSSAVKTNALPTFKSFARAVKQKNQACVDALSSSFFKQQQAAAFPDAHGKWVTNHQSGAASLSDNLAKLPNTLNDTSFTQTPYTRPLTSSAEQPTGPQTYQPAGLTLSYPVDGPNGVPYHLAISILAENHKVVVDNVELKPASLDSGRK